MHFASSPQTHKRLEIIVFGEDWGSHPSSTQHIIKRLIPNHDIVWINSLGLRRPKVNAQDFKRACNKLKNMLHKRNENTIFKANETDVTHIVHPRAISWPGNPLASLLNRYLLGQQIESIIETRGFNMPILWASMPSAINAIDNYPNHKVVYYCGDDFRALAGVDHRPVEKMEKRLAARADLIIVASKPLQKRFPEEKTVLLEHGVDYELFSTDAPRAPDFPDHPLIAGFYGSIHDWLDMGIIVQAAQACPEWTFVFIGNVHINISSLKTLKNIKFLGARAHKNLPSYIQHWQVSMLPFKDCEQIRACNPLKLKEYLSAGRPIVSTEFPALTPYRKNVHVMRNANELITILNNLKDSISGPRKPDNTMQMQTWGCKAKLVEKHLLSL
ncbi:MAG: glycosyl transferase [Zetaproteobacteria bacterium]|nr:MAG: glycosyl transferase [Zetaproteobacteria bacterium]